MQLSQIAENQFGDYESENWKLCNVSSTLPALSAIIADQEFCKKQETRENALTGNSKLFSSQFHVDI